MSALPLASPASRQRALAVVLRDLFALRHSVVRLFEMLYWPLVELLIWGFVSAYLQVNKVPAVVAGLLGGVLLVMGWALGIFAVGVILRFGHSAEIIAWALSFAFQPFAAVFYPVATLPGPMQAVAAFVPASHVFEGMRSVIAGRGVDTRALAAAAVVDLLYLVAAIWFFRRMLVAARRSGGLSRFAD